MHKNSPYFSFYELAFQTPGSDIEASINLRAALKVLGGYIEGKEAQSDAVTALDFIQARVDKIRPFCDEIRKCFALEDPDQEDFKYAVLERAFAGIEDRIKSALNTPKNNRRKRRF